jgi:hypothetical protein
MQIDIAKSLFPAYAAAAVQLKGHGVDAVHHVQDATHTADMSARLDASVRAFTSLDHAIDNVNKLPVDWFVPNAGKYIAGYQAAKTAVTILIATGVIPGARERVGKQQILAASDYFKNGVTAALTDSSKYGAKLASGFLDSTIEDATAGVAMLRPGTPIIQELLTSLKTIRTAADSRKPIDPSLVNRVNAIFTDAASQLDQRIAAATATAPTLSPKAAADVIAQTDQLLAQARHAGELLVKDAPRVVPLARPVA